MAEALLGAEPDAQGYSISSCFTCIDDAEKAFYYLHLCFKKLFLSVFFIFLFVYDVFHCLKLL